MTAQMTNAYLELARRCEEASGPNYQLEQEIGAAVFPKQATIYPAYTASLDAAMSLVPAGCWGAFDPRFMDDEGDVRFYGYIFRPNWPRWTPHGDWVEEVKKGGLCATPALALCAAALRARAQ